MPRLVLAAALLVLGACGEGREMSHPVGLTTNWSQPRNLVGSFTAMDRIFPARMIAPAASPRPLPRSEAPFPPVRFLAEGRTWTLDEFLARGDTTAFLVLARDGTILLERYLQGRRPEDRFTSWSMGKTVIGALIGIAQAEGRIASLDDPAGRYVPDLGRSSSASPTATRPSSRTVA